MRQIHFELCPFLSLLLPMINQFMLLFVFFPLLLLFFFILPPRKVLIGLTDYGWTISNADGVPPVSPHVLNLNNTQGYRGC